MKLTKSKQFLADAIHASGKGWPDGANWAWYGVVNQCGFFGSEKPVYSKSEHCFKIYSHEEVGKFECAKFNNWHQTVLGRDEYFSAYPEKVEPVADADGWIDHDGAKCPVATGVAVDVKYSDGGTMLNLPANLPHHTRRTAAPCWWDHDGMSGDIIAYRLHRPVVDAEFCESVTSRTPEPEPNEKLSSDAVEAAKIALMSESIEGLKRKPTIEQLAADYRNAKDYAERKQEEADAAKADAEAKLAELIAAGKVIGLLVSPINEKQEPDMVITY